MPTREKASNRARKTLVAFPFPNARCAKVSLPFCHYAAAFPERTCRPVRCLSLIHILEDFISTHEAAAAWIRSKDGTTWCSSSETDLYDPALENELFGPAMAGETGSSEMYLGHAGERRILFYAPIVEAPVAASPGAAAAPVSPDDVLGAVYVSYPADELQNSYGTTYSSAGATFVVDSSGTIVLDANRSAEDVYKRQEQSCSD